MKKSVFITLMFVFIIIIISFWNDGYSNDVIKYVNYNGNKLRISIDGESSNTLPTSGTYYLVDYDCKNSNTEITWDKTNYILNVSNAEKKGGVACNLKFKSKPLLSEMPVGSYVKYVGNNGCVGNSCNGDNANYVSDNDMGYCHLDDFKFYVNGWRIGYIKNDSVHLISAGSTDCICTNSDGTININACSEEFSTTSITFHVYNMDKIALKYCNKNFAMGGVCDENSTWAMDEADFIEIFNKNLTTCNVHRSDVFCGYNNDLLDNGGYYWFGTVYGGTTIQLFRWSPQNRYIYYHNTNILLGVRPVLSLSPSVVVTDGDGTYESPYEISNYNFWINDDDGIITDSTSKSNVELILSSSDASTMCIGVDTSVCTNYVAYSNSYTLDLSSESNGKHFIFVYYKDSNGNIVYTMNKSITIDV